MYQIAKYLASLLKPFVSKTKAYANNSASFMVDIDLLVLSPTYIMVILDLVYLFSSVPVEPTLELLNQLFADPVVDLFKCSCHGFSPKIQV